MGGRVYTLEGIWAQRYPTLRIKGHGTRYQERTCHHRYPTIPVYRQTPMKTLHKAQPLPCTRNRTSFVKCLTLGNVHTCSTWTLLYMVPSPRHLHMWSLCSSYCWKSGVVGIQVKYFLVVFFAFFSNYFKTLSKYVNESNKTSVTWSRWHLKLSTITVDFVV